MEEDAIPTGYCQCGCGELAPIARRTTTRLGHVKGEPIRFIDRHQNARNLELGRQRLRERPKWLEQDRGHETPCWVWQLGRGRHGYGVVGVGEARNMLAHRWVYEQHLGPIPGGLPLDHLCRVIECVNPAHLEPVPHAVNVRRGLAVKRPPEQVAEIKGLYLAGYRPADIMRAYQICSSQLHGIARGARRADIAALREGVDTLAGELGLRSVLVGDRRLRSR